jgi:hypothetical protein
MSLRDSAIHPSGTVGRNKDLTGHLSSRLLREYTITVFLESTRKHRNTTFSRRSYFWRLIFMGMLLRCGMNSRFG